MKNILKFFFWLVFILASIIVFFCIVTYTPNNFYTYKENYMKLLSYPRWDYLKKDCEWVEVWICEIIHQSNIKKVSIYSPSYIVIEENKPWYSIQNRIYEYHAKHWEPSEKPKDAIDFEILDTNWATFTIKLFL